MNLAYKVGDVVYHSGKKATVLELVVSAAPKDPQRYIIQHSGYKWSEVENRLFSAPVKSATYEPDNF